MVYGHVIQTEIHYSIPNACVELTDTIQGLQETCLFLQQQLEASIKNEYRYLANAS